ncbi:hypothetical protein HOT57_gp51 [Pseudomonas phage phCDa]|uniref:Uncharacterized protein n=1 Tax=Pseudomonas phage phCDa TaxID=2268587 RepID=A0A2Z5H8V5_9CAUD|nr:hypothetical protein HOT57_gp51 [Pseudomonas phage phCDa]AXC36495.1 hypothetical protein phCDa_51 [Pseudomonas phage phCDa]
MIRNILTKTFTVLKILVCALVAGLRALPKACEDLRKAAENIETRSKLLHLKHKDDYRD